MVLIFYRGWIVFDSPVIFRFAIETNGISQSAQAAGRLYFYPVGIAGIVCERNVLDIDNLRGSLGYGTSRCRVAAGSYAEGYQHLTDGTYEAAIMPPITEQAVIMPASHFYESRDGSTGGFFADNVQAGQQV